jgi:RNA polymerase sigma factor (sigma-70 family)
MFARDPLANPEPLIRRVYAYVAYRIGDGAEAEDITSETFERALRYRASFKTNKGEPIGWLLGIARNCLADAVRNRLDLAEPVEHADPADFAGESLERLYLAQALATLDERERELVALRYGADLTAKQIGLALGLKTNAVEVALHRTLGKLRVLLEPERDGLVRNVANAVVSLADDPPEGSHHVPQPPVRPGGAPAP